MAVWRYVARDLRTGTLLGELPLGGASLGQLLNRPGDLQAVIDLGARSSLTSQRITQGLIDGTLCARTVIWCQRDNRLFDGYIVWDRLKPIEGRLWQLLGMSLLSYFDHRTISSFKNYVGVDQHDIARDLITFAQGMPGGNIGIVNNTTNDSGVLRDRTYLAFERRNLGEALRDLAEVQNGSDFWIDVALVNQLPQATFRLGYPRKGQSQTQNHLLFTLGRMMRDYSLEERGSEFANRVHGIGAGEGTDKLVRTRTDSSSINQGYPLLERVISHIDVSVESTLFSHIDRDLAEHSTVPETWTAVVEPDDESIPFGSWTVGDDARFVIPAGADGRFPAGADVVKRIVGQTIQPGDDGGPDTVTLQLGRQWTSG
jgi:hypothetical protein